MKKQTIENKNIALSVKNLSKKYKGKNFAIQNLSFNVLPGEFHGFIGANGAGKTTTIKSIIGAYAKYQGEVKLFGQSNKSLSAKKHLGYIPETARFPSNMTVFRYLTYMSYLSGYSFKESKKFAKEKILELGLEKVANRSPNTFSSGQKKKVLLAQALIGNPDIIIMDEPAANLDPVARNEFFKDLKILQKKGKAIFISSHILSELDQFVDSITIIDGGKIAYTGKIDDINFNEKIYHFSFKNEKDNKLFYQFLKEEKKEFKFKKDIFIIEIKSNITMNKLLDFIKDNNLTIENINKNKLSLNAIYDKYVIKGSLATGTGKKKGVKNG